MCGLVVVRRPAIGAAWIRADKASQVKIKVAVYILRDRVLYEVPWFLGVYLIQFCIILEVAD